MDRKNIFRKQEQGSSLDHKEILQARRQDHLLLLRFNAQPKPRHWFKDED